MHLILPKGLMFYASTILLYGQIFSCIIPCRSPSPPSCVYFYAFFFHYYYHYYYYFVLSFFFFTVFKTQGTISQYRLFVDDTCDYFFFTLPRFFGMLLFTLLYRNNLHIYVCVCACVCVCVCARARVCVCVCALDFLAPLIPIKHCFCDFVTLFLVWRVMLLRTLDEQCLSVIDYTKSNKHGVANH